jgi:hypothetical protein
MDSYRMGQTAQFQSKFHSVNGANLSEISPGPQQTGNHDSTMSKPRIHLLRQLSWIAAAFLGSALFSIPVARAIQDPTSQDEKDSDKNGADQDKDKEKKKSPFSKDVRNIKEYEIPEAQLKDLLRGTRPHRKQKPALLREDVREPRKPTQDELKRFEELKKQEVKKPEDLAVIDVVIQRQVGSLTQPQREWYLPSSEGRKSRDAIEAILDSTSGLGSTESFQMAYKTALLKHLPELLQNHILVRVNAMKLLSKLKDERTIPLFCEQIRDLEQHESIRFFAMKGLENLGQRKLISQVSLETQAVNTLLDVLAKPDDVHSYTLQQAVRALGAIGRPNRVVGGDDVDVAIALLKILRDPNIRNADRAEVAGFLANLQVSAQADYNYQYIAYEIGRFAASVASAAANDPAVDDLHSDMYLVESSYALVAEKRPERSSLFDRAKKNTKANASGDPIYVRSLGDQVTKLTVEALKVYKPDVVSAKSAVAKPQPKPADDLLKKAEEIKSGLGGRFTDQLNVLNDMLKSRPPRSMKLTPNVEELGPPPALAGQDPAAAAAAESDASDAPKG